MSGPSRRRLFAWLILAAGASVPACASSDGGAEEPSSEGERIYREPVADGNTWACATCHALSEPAEDFRRPAHPIGDAAARPSFKNGQVAELREAVNSCLVEWMNAEPWSADDQRWLELEKFLRAQAPAEAPALSFAIVPPPGDLSGGDRTRGRATFDGACAVCHGDGGIGTNLAPAVAGFALQPKYVAERVRLSGRAMSSVYDGLSGGIMPFWAADRLSDGELRDLVAFLAEGGIAEGGETSSETSSATDAGDDTEGGGTSSPGESSEGGTAHNCPITHDKVGWVAELTEQFHGVGGIAEIVDDCTVVVHGFTYDGAGIDVRLYGGVGGDYDGGYPMTDNLLVPGGYDGVELEAVLPDDKTLDDLDGVSVWCVDVGIDFGSGSFAPP